MNLQTSIAPVMGTGFADPAIDSVIAFRRILDAMSRPGTIVRLPFDLELPTPLHTATAAACLTLFGRDTPVWLDNGKAYPSVADYLRFRSGCPFSDRPTAHFALVLDPRRVPDLDLLDPGTPERPELSTTLILQVTGLTPDSGARLTGPGIEVMARLGAEGLSDDFWEQRRRHQRLFPCGVDILFTCGTQLAALPRSTSIEV